MHFARPMRQLDAVVTLYNQGLGLPSLRISRAHAGYDEVMFDLPGRNRNGSLPAEVGQPMPSTR
ncbi:MULTISPECIES: hypothetical protein [Pseudomonas]|uniref:hypothetical protein n=1 Tax=Pseudomonas TaxID=286 RepID=UPI0035E3C665